jgi:hypothetical protein
MARGSSSKTVITNKILETFDGAFLYNDGKEIRIPILEDGEIVQIKVTLTCAKTNVEPDGDNVLPGAAAAESSGAEVASQPTSSRVIEPSDEEKENVRKLLERLNL